MTQQNLIDHYVLVIDASSSMRTRAAELIKVVDAQVEYWARKSQEYNRETRVSVYVFNNDVRCVVWDMDVLRLPRIGTFYNTEGMTALRNATAIAIADLQKTPQMYGDHAFVLYTFTDGEENFSDKAAPYTTAQQLHALLSGLPENWTVAALVPNFNCKRDALHHGFPAGNVAVWDMASDKGVTEAMETIQAATDNFMQARATGVRHSKNLFGGTDAVNAKTVAATGLQPLDPSDFMIVPVPGDIPDRTEISHFINNVAKLKFPGDKAARGYELGKVFYELKTKVDKKGHRRGQRVQAQKVVAVMEVATSKVFMGPEARKLVGLPDHEVTVHPDKNPSHVTFIQSTSTNRHLMPHQRLLVLR